MWFSDISPIVTAAVTGGSLLVGYFVQKYVEHRRTIAEKRLETYSMFIKSTLTAIESRISKQSFNSSEEIFWKAQVSLYGSDKVIRKLGEFTTLLPRVNEAHHSSEISEVQVAAAFDELMLAMRRDITLNSNATLQDLRKISPILIDRLPAKINRTTKP